MEVPSIIVAAGPVAMGEVFHIDDLLDFSNEDIAGPIGEGGMQLSSLEPSESVAETVTSTCSLSLAESMAQTPSILDDKEHTGGDLCVPCEDLAELEWLSKFVEDSFEAPRNFSSSSGTLTVSTDMQIESYSTKDHFQSSSPISVLESSASSGRAGNIYRELSVPGRARSKRSRTGGRVWGASGILTLSSGNDTESLCSDSDMVTVTNSCQTVSASSQCMPRKLGKASKGGKKGHDATQPWRCTHCATQRTPQWRAGPLGPKTLCNACGVRYKSGRLLPEYRPAGSPGYIFHKHSNSHKKILEMRRSKYHHEEESMLSSSFQGLQQQQQQQQSLQDRVL